MEEENVNIEEEEVNEEENNIKCLTISIDC